MSRLAEFRQLEQKTGRAAGRAGSNEGLLRAAERN